MEPSTLSQLLLSFAWDEWSQMGILAAPRTQSPWAQDPEALIVFSLEVARADPRLFDELLDWMLLNESLLSVRRLRSMCIEDTDGALIGAALAWLAHQRPRARLRAQAPGPPPGPLTPLFEGGSLVARPDQSFAAFGLLRPEVASSGKSSPPDSMAPINLAFRLRQILGVGIRAEVIRVLLTLDAPWVSAAALARSTGYSKRNVHEALAGLAVAHTVTYTVGAEQRYTANRAAWAGLLELTPAQLPEHRDWPQLLGALRSIQRFTRAQAGAEEAEYLRASGARQLLESLRPSLSFAGIAVNPRLTAAGAPDELESVLRRLLERLNVAAVEHPKILAESDRTNLKVNGMPRNERHMVPNESGGWNVTAPGAQRSSAHAATQGEAIERARQIVHNSGGGEVVIHGRDGQIRDSDTVAPGHDPNPPRDTR